MSKKQTNTEIRRPRRAVRIQTTGPTVVSTDRINRGPLNQLERNSVFGPIIRPISDPRPFTKIEYFLGIFAIGVMGFLYLVHRSIPEDAGWVRYTIYMMIFASTGLIFTQLWYGQPPIPMDWKNGFRPLVGPNGNIEDGLNSGLRAAIIYIASIITQLFSKTVLSFSSEEQKIYFVMAAVAEELFFRVMILSGLLKFRSDWATKLIANAVQTAFFVAIHQNYYNNPPMLLSVALGGFILGLFFIWWRDPTANVLAHFFLNLQAVGAL